MEIKMTIKFSDETMRSEIEGSGEFSLSTRIYFQERLRHRLYDLVMREFDQYRSKGKTRAQLAERLGKRPEQIIRWLSGPGNLTIDTLSDLLLGLSGAELAMSLEYPTEERRQPPRLPEAFLQAKKKAKNSLTTTVVTQIRPLSETAANAQTDAELPSLDDVRGILNPEVLDKESEQANTRDCVEAGETAATDRMTEADLATKLWDAWACGRDDNDGWRKVARFVRGMGQPEANARAERAEAAVEAARRIIEATLLAETANAYGRGCEEKSRQIAEAMGMTIRPSRELTVTWNKDN
jgi:transcriptional regulator with XRE-family HTH domain